MEERIYGTESEYALVFTAGDGTSNALLPTGVFQERLQFLTGRLVLCLEKTGGPIAGEFLGNGGRFYIDRGGHPEYATPECRGPLEIVRYEKAGDALVRKLVDAVRLETGEKENRSKLHVYKNNADLFGNSYGGHENYLIKARAEDRIEELVPFLVTRQVICGAGMVADEGPGGRPGFMLSQRARFIDRVFSDRTSGVRGIVNTRRREIRGREEDRRLHVIVGDSNLCEFALWMKVGTMGLVLRVLEEEGLGNIPALRFPVKALKAVAGSFEARLEMENRQGGYTALEVQRMYLEAVQRFFASNRPGWEEERLLRAWAGILDDLAEVKISGGGWKLEEDPGESRRKLDWILKLWLLGRLAEKGGNDQAARAMKTMDLRYHDLDPDAGGYLRCKKLGLVDCLATEEEIDRAGTAPPAKTRARLRGEIIRRSAGKNVQVAIENWEKIDVRAKTEKHGRHNPFDRYVDRANTLEIGLSDPFLFEDDAIMEQLDRFMEVWS